MIFYIPGEIISLLTFPGIIVHEFSHRFFCDLFNVPVYHISYYIPFAKTAGGVVHAKTDNLNHNFLIAAGPLIINSLICILLSASFACKFFWETGFLATGNSFIIAIRAMLLWIGISIGFSAIPSKTDVKGLMELTKSVTAKILVGTFVGIIYLFNLPYISFLFRFIFLLMLMGIPVIILSIIF